MLSAGTNLDMKSRIDWNKCGIGRYPTTAASAIRAGNKPIRNWYESPDAKAMECFLGRLLAAFLNTLFHCCRVMP
jgi:hypothetical protein